MTPSHYGDPFWASLGKPQARCLSRGNPDVQKAGAHRGVEFRYAQAAQDIPLITDSPQCNVVSSPIRIRTLWDDGHIAQGNRGHLQPRPTGHQLAFSVQGNMSLSQGITVTAGSGAMSLSSLLV